MIHPWTRRTRVVVVVALAAGWCPRVSPAAEPAAVPVATDAGVKPPVATAIIEGKSSCPRPESVWRALETLIPLDQLGKHTGTLSPSSSKVEILDLGQRYRVIVGGSIREYRDDAHDCEHRARVAAVFVALTLAPAYFGQPVQVGAVPASPVPPLAPVAEPGPRWLQVNVGASYIGGISHDHHVAPAVTLHVALARGRWGVVAGAAVPFPNDATVNRLGVREFRAPGDVSLRARSYLGKTELAADAGVTIAWLSEHATELRMSSAQSAVEVGARLAMTLRFSTAAVVAPFLTGQLEFVPRPTVLWDVPQGRVGQTPMLWAGVTVGVSLGL